jgi:hypothetical protein
MGAVSGVKKSMINNELGKSAKRDSIYWREKLSEKD